MYPTNQTYRTGQTIPFQTGAPPFWYNAGCPIVIVRPEYGATGAYRVVNVSRNLRGMINRAHKVGVSRVSVSRTSNGAFVYVGFADGSELRNLWADYSVARAFFLCRAKRWGLLVTDDINNLWLFSTAY